jgi:hypothetical protein
MTKRFINFLENIYGMREVSWGACKVGVGGDYCGRAMFASDPDFMVVVGAFDVVTGLGQLSVTRGVKNTPRGYDCASPKSGKKLSVGLQLPASGKKLWPYKAHHHHLLHKACMPFVA